METETVRIQVRDFLAQAPSAWRWVWAVFPDGREAKVEVEFDGRNMQNILRLEGNGQPMILSKMHPDIRLEAEIPKTEPYVTPPEIANHPFRTGKL